MSIFLARKLMVTILSLSLFVPPLVSAAEDEYVCDAKQSSKNELPVLSQSCPIGKGIWGGKPSAETGMFWIQCGLLNAPLSLKEAQPIYRSISTDVWIKPESKGYRCLIGPYETFSNASSDLVKVRKLKPYKEAFIRDASGGNSEPAVMKTKPAPKPKAKPVAKPKPKATPKPVVPPVAATEKPVPVVKQTPKVAATAASDTVVARRDVKIGEKYFAIPFLMEGDEQFYMEYGIAWNRLSYDRANEVCSSQKMRLPNPEEWKLLNDSQVMTKKQWPIHLPYWGENRQGLFTSGKVTQLTGTSLLNVVCVK